VTQEPIRDKVERLVKDLAGAVQMRGMYSKEHTLFKSSLNTLYYMLDDVLFEEKEITIGVIGDEVAYGKEPFYETSRQIKGFIQHLKSIGADKITFYKGLNLQELVEFVSILALNPETIKRTGGFEVYFKMGNITNVAVGKISLRKKDQTDQPAEAPEDVMLSARKNYNSGENLMKEIFDDINTNQVLNVEGIRIFVSNIINNLLNNRASLLILTAVKSHDEYSFVHNINVSIFSVLQAEGLGLEQRYLNDIGAAGLLHDVGKISIPGEILRKKGALTEEEFAIIKRHSVYGAKLLLESPDINVLAAKVAFEHHIRYDMGGYPDRAFDKRVGLASMIVTISDFYDALRSKRAYAGEVAPEKTYEEMIKLSGKHFHPLLLDHFFRLVGVYPPGTLVELDSDEIAIVVKESSLDIKRPQVEVIYDKNGNSVGEPYLLNLTEKDPATGKFKKTILRSIISNDKFEVPEKYKPSAP